MISARRSSLLPWIVAFKAAKALLLTALGCALLLAIHRRSPVDLVVRLAQAVQLSHTSRLFERMLRFAVRVTPREEMVAALTAFGYAVLMTAEGVGLYLRRSWARSFTIGATSSLMPIELYKILREPRVLRLLVLVLNLAVVLVYLSPTGSIRVIQLSLLIDIDVVVGGSIVRITLETREVPTSQAAALSRATVD